MVVVVVFRGFGLAVFCSSSLSLSLLLLLLLLPLLLLLMRFFFAHTSTVLQTIATVESRSLFHLLIPDALHSPLTDNLLSVPCRPPHPGKHAEYFGGDSTVTLAAEDTEDGEEEDGDVEGTRSFIKSNSVFYRVSRFNSGFDTRRRRSLPAKTTFHSRFLFWSPKPVGISVASSVLFFWGGGLVFL